MLLLSLLLGASLEVPILYTKSLVAPPYSSIADPPCLATGTNWNSFSCMLAPEQNLNSEWHISCLPRNFADMIQEVNSCPYSFSIFLWGKINTPTLMELTKGIFQRYDIMVSIYSRGRKDKGGDIWSVGVCLPKLTVVRPDYPEDGWMPTQTWEVVNQFLALLSLCVQLLPTILTVFSWTTNFPAFSSLILFTSPMVRDWVRGCEGLCCWLGVNPTTSQRVPNLSCFIGILINAKKAKKCLG